jgi:glycosyltransferase involved in cell wall biosynthesis
MISICIPIYNFDVRNLVLSLYDQSINSDFNIEIILIDDCSDSHIQKINSDIKRLAKYIQLDKNIGRSKIRNLFLNYAKEDYLLFLDCDSMVVNENFIKNYIDSISDKTELIVGGRIYSTDIPEKNKLLRWKYCIIREQKPLSVQHSSIDRPFMSNNFLIKKSLFEQLKFEERIFGYGHEDTLFGYELKKRNISVSYINNPVMNGELETNEEFLVKTENSLINLKLILDLLNYDKGFIDEVNLLRTYYKIRKIKVDLIIFMIFSLIKNLLRKLLISGVVNLKLFDFYKLGFFISVMISNKSKTS